MSEFQTVAIFLLISSSEVGKYILHKICYPMCSFYLISKEDFEMQTVAKLFKFYQSEANYVKF